MPNDLVSRRTARCRSPSRATKGRQCAGDNGSSDRRRSGGRRPSADAGPIGRRGARRARLRL